MIQTIEYILTTLLVSRIMYSALVTTATSHLLSRHVESLVLTEYYSESLNKKKTLRAGM